MGRQWVWSTLVTNHKSVLRGCQYCPHSNHISLSYATDYLAGSPVVTSVQQAGKPVVLTTSRADMHLTFQSWHAHIPGVLMLVSPPSSSECLAIQNCCEVSNVEWHHQDISQLPGCQAPQWMMQSPATPLLCVVTASFRRVLSLKVCSNVASQGISHRYTIYASIYALILKPEKFTCTQKLVVLHYFYHCSINILESQ